VFFCGHGALMLKFNVKFFVTINSYVLYSNILTLLRTYKLFLQSLNYNEYFIKAFIFFFYCNLLFM